MLLSRLHATATNASAASSAAARRKRLDNRRQLEKANGNAGADVDEDPSFRSDSPFPWSAAGVALVCGTIYYKISNVVAVGMFVPIVNGVFFVCLTVFAFHKLKGTEAFGSGRKTLRQRLGGGSARRGARRRGARGSSHGGRSTYLFG